MEAINKTDWLTDFMGDEAVEIGKAFELLKIKLGDCLQETDLQASCGAFPLSFPAGGLTKQMQDHFVKEYNLRID